MNRGHLFPELSTVALYAEREIANDKRVKAQSRREALDSEIQYRRARIHAKLGKYFSRWHSNDGRKFCQIIKVGITEVTIREITVEKSEHGTNWRGKYILTKWKTKKVHIVSFMSSWRRISKKTFTTQLRRARKIIDEWLEGKFTPTPAGKRR